MARTSGSVCAFAGREYADGTAPGAGDSSDYFVKSIEYTTAGGEVFGEAGDDVINGGTGDDVIFGDLVADSSVFDAGGGDFPAMPHAISNIVLYLQDGTGDIVKVKIDSFDGSVHDADDVDLQEFIDVNFPVTTLVAATVKAGYNHLGMGPGEGELFILVDSVDLSDLEAAGKPNGAGEESRGWSVGGDAGDPGYAGQACALEQSRSGRGAGGADRRGRAGSTSR